MKLQSGLSELLYGILLSILFFWTYLTNPLISYYIPLIFCSLIVILTGIFKLVAYYNKNIYQFSVIAILTLMWVISYFWISLEDDIVIYYVLTGLITLISVIMIVFVPKEWEKI